MIEIAADARKALRLLRPRIDRVTKGAIANFLNYTRCCVRRDLGRARPTCQRRFAEWRAVGKRQNSKHAILVLDRHPVEWPRLERLLAWI